VNRFAECLPIVLGKEGGYVDHPHDNGGPTSHGVTQATYNKYMDGLVRPRKPVIDIEPAEIEDIYHVFWTAAQCDRIEPMLDLLVFDAAINSGPAKAIIFLQRALGMQERYQTGNFGPITTRMLSDAITADGTTAICRRYLDIRRKFYHARVRLDPTQASFINGWLSRLDQLGKLI